MLHFHVTFFQEMVIIGPVPVISSECLNSFLLGLQFSSIELFTLLVSSLLQIKIAPKFYPRSSKLNFSEFELSIFFYQNGENLAKI